MDPSSLLSAAGKEIVTTTIKGMLKKIRKYR